MPSGLDESLIRRCLSLAGEGKTQMADAESGTDMSIYHDTGRFRHEIDRAFRAMPTVVAHACALAEPDGYLALERYGVPLLITRTPEGVRGFINACRHRGTRLVEGSSGCRRAFACPYHGWTYRNDGTLTRVPHAEGFPNLDMAENGLVELPTWERFGLIWVVCDPRAECDIDAFLKPVAEELGDLALDTHGVFDQRTTTWTANWKLIAEGGLESYHFRITHSATIAPYFLQHCSLFDVLGSHVRVTLPRRSITELDDTDPATWRLRSHAHIVYQLFPNCALLVQDDHIAMFTLHPLAVDRTEITYTMLVPAAEHTQERRQHWTRNFQITDTTLCEDYAMAERIQATVASSANARMRFGLYEAALGAFNRIVDTHLHDGDHHPRNVTPIQRRR